MQENCYELRVQLSAKGKRVVKGHYTDAFRPPYGSKWHKYEEKMENCNNQKCRKVKNLWFKITIPYGRSYDKMWLLTSIENECGFHFRAFQFHYVNNMAAFFVDNFSTARSLVQVSRMIQDEHYHKIVIKATPLYLPNEQMDTNNLHPLNEAYFLEDTTADIQDELFFKDNLFFEEEEPKPLPQAKGSFFVNNEIKTFLAKFLHQYFSLYDSVDRKDLLPLYHENACCSFSLPKAFYPRACFNQIKEYWKENRNLLRVTRPEMRRQLIKYNRLQVVGFLCNLPKTEHELASMMVDVSFQTVSLMCFTIEGRFQEVQASGRRTPLISFRRTLLVVPASGDSAQIINDQIVILDTYKGPQETPSRAPPKSVLAICERAPRTAACDVVRSFSTYTSMKPDWALKCLQDNNWDVQQAKDVFHHLKDRGAIPAEAFDVKELAAIISA